MIRQSVASALALARVNCYPSKIKAGTHYLVEKEIATTICSVLGLIEKTVNKLKLEWIL
jgi:hypothetical protein